MSEKQKIELLKELMITGQIDVDWSIKNIFGFDPKSQYRKSKIQRLLNDKARKI